MSKLTLISSATASSSASISFTSGIDSTYDEYQFWCVDIHPASANVPFAFQVNASGQSGFNETIASSPAISNGTIYLRSYQALYAIRSSQ